MELRIGEYIRSQDGNIDKVRELGDQSDEDLMNVIRGERHSYWKDDITKHSEDITDLVEADDIVNGKQVIEIRKQNGKTYLMTDYAPQKYITSEIKEILTHELYEKNVKKFVL